MIRYASRVVALIAAIDQRVTDARGAQLAEGDPLRGWRLYWLEALIRYRIKVDDHCG